MEEKRTSRRGFFGALGGLLAAPFAAKIAERPGWRLRFDNKPRWDIISRKLLPKFSYGHSIVGKFRDSEIIALEGASHAAMDSALTRLDTRVFEDAVRTFASPAPVSLTYEHSHADLSLSMPVVFAHVPPETWDDRTPHSVSCVRPARLDPSVPCGPRDRLDAEDDRGAGGLQRSPHGLLRAPGEEAGIGGGEPEGPPGDGPARGHGVGQAGEAPDALVAAGDYRPEHGIGQTDAGGEARIH